MTEDDALDIVMERLGRRTSTTLRASVLLEMALAQQDLEDQPSRLWFLKTSAVVGHAAGNAFGSLPTGNPILGFDYTQVAAYVNTDGSFPTGGPGMKALQRVSEAAILTGEVRTSRPEAWAQVTSSLVEGHFSYVVYPTPDITYNILFNYYARASRALWLVHAPQVLLARTCRNAAATLLHDTELAGVFDQQEKQAWDSLMRRNTAMESDELDLIKGGE